MKQLCFTAFDHGITHFDLANNYGPNPGSAERNPGRILREELGAYRDGLVISTKAGYEMWDGPYGNWGSRKHILASLDQSLQRMGLPYVDIFYHHRMDSNTPLEETMSALAQAVAEGKALYVGLSNYDGRALEKACKILNELRCPFRLFHRPLRPAQNCDKLEPDQDWEDRTHETKKYDPGDHDRGRHGDPLEHRFCKCAAQHGRNRDWGLPGPLLRSVLSHHFFKKRERLKAVKQAKRTRECTTFAGSFCSYFN